MKAVIYRAVIAFLILNCSSLGCEEIKNRPIPNKPTMNMKGNDEIKPDTLRKVKAQSTDLITLVKEITAQDVRVFYKWYPILEKTSDEYLCVVIRHPINIHGLSTAFYRLSFYKVNGNKLFNTYAYDSDVAEPFESLTPIVNAGNRILVTFSRASGPHYLVFALIDGEIRIVLNESIEGPLEMIDIDNDGDLEIFLTDKGPVRNAITKEIIIYPEETEVFRWNGKNYELIRRVPWKNRFQELLKK